MPNYGYHLARAEGDLVRRIYRAFIPKVVERTITPRTSIPLEVFSYSGHAGLPEQVASIRSFSSTQVGRNNLRLFLMNLFRTDIELLTTRGSSWR